MAGFISVEGPCLVLLRWLDISEKKTVNREITSRVNDQGPTASVEWRLLLAGSSADADAGESDFARAHMLEPQEAGRFDWDLVLRLAEGHGTSSLLYQNLASSGAAVPAAVLASLRQRHETNVRKSLFMARELTRILDCTDSLGVEVIPYKGTVLSEVYYGDIALRQSGDIDLFVRKLDVARIKSAVCDLGYAPRFTIPEDSEEDYIESGYEWTFDSAAGKNLLELQWALQPRFYSVDFDMDGLFDRAANTMVAGRRVKTPSSEDLLLVLAVHAAKHVWGRLIWLCDIAQILKRENLNWDFVQARARQFGIERILHVTLLLTNRFLTTKIPLALETATREDRGARVFADEIEVAVVKGMSYEEQKISYFHLMMRLRERRVDQLRFLTRLTFTPGPGEWEAVHLPKLLFPLYRVVRMARLATMWAKK